MSSLIDTTTFKVMHWYERGLMVDTLNKALF